MRISLPELPYALNSLEPHISENTVSFHYNKHHKGYVNKLNELINNTSLESLSLEEIILESAGKPELVGIFNNAAQVWNHTFYWESMKPNGGGEPTEEFLSLLEDSFGSFDTFKQEFKDMAVSQFGSGWVWLVEELDQLKIIKTSNAETPIAHKVNPLLTCDVWEHAYYLDFQNRRPDYVGVFLNHLANWQFAEANLKRNKEI